MDLFIQCGLLVKINVPCIFHIIILMLKIIVPRYVLDLVYTLCSSLREETTYQCNLRTLRNIISIQIAPCNLFIYSSFIEIVHVAACLFLDKFILYFIHHSVARPQPHTIFGSEINGWQ
jgi:hypothetical protein